MISRTKHKTEIDQLVELKREELLTATGLTDEPVKHYMLPEERRISKSESTKVTLLYTGLTKVIRTLTQASMVNLGYNAVPLPISRKADFHTGKEFGNNGMCSPAYFVTGALINYLKQLRDEKGMSTEQICRDYAFVNSGACGPCRFGMYEAEHRLTLRNSGFEGFRTIFFEQKTGLAQARDEEGLSFNEYFFLALLNSAFIGDALNELISQIRPYEIETGNADQIFDKVVSRMCECMLSKQYDCWNGSLLAKFLNLIISDANTGQLENVLDQLFGDHYLSALHECTDILNEELEVDFAQPKPVCKIVGEFYAQMAEGDGNYRMLSYLESNGAEVIIEPFVNWPRYLLDSAYFRTISAKNVWNPEERKWDIKGRLRKELRYWFELARLKVLSGTWDHEYNRIRKALGNIPRPLISQKEIRHLAEPYYNPKIMGGEGHLEIGKTIYYSINNICHMTLGLKPFGCLPSTQSDAAMAAVTAQYPEILYLPIETSGEGDINAYSRVQMLLTEAKTRARDEFNTCVKKTGYTIEEIRDYCGQNRHLRRPMQHIKRHKGVTGRGANFVLNVGKLMGKNKYRS